MTPRFGLPQGILVRAGQLVVAGLAVGAVFTSAGADRNEDYEAVFAQPFHGYQRTVLADGTYRAETYTLRKGRFYGGALADPSIDKLGFDDITRAVARPLAEQNYVRARDAKAAQLRIVVSWGTTTAPEYRSMSMASAQLEDAQRGQHGIDSVMMNSAAMGALSGSDDAVTAGVYSGLPGFSALESAGSSGVGPRGPGGGSQGRSTSAQADIALHQDQLDASLRGAAGADQLWAQEASRNAQLLGYANPGDSELQRFRYFVILAAYDNHAASGTRAKLLWVTRISISEHQSYFDQRLAGMVRSAADYFGQASGGLVHRRLPEGRVEIGPVRSLDDVSAVATAALSPDGRRVAYLHDSRYGRTLVIVDLDHPSQIESGEVPNLGALPMEIAWSDPTHVEVTLSSNAAFTFDSGGHRADVWTAPAWVPPVPDRDEVTAAAAAKFPHRLVALRGWDLAGQRFLLQVTGGDGGARYYVYDRPADVLVDLGSAPKLL